MAVQLRGLLLDYAGVLTPPAERAIAVFCAREKVDSDSLRTVIASAYAADAQRGSEIHELELGRLTLPEFDRRLAARLRTTDGSPVSHEDLTRRLFACLGSDDGTLAAAADRLRASGVRVGLLSNSWGSAEGYDREALAERFDAVVLSSEVGLRKPQPEIFALAAERLGVPPAGCVFVDDFPVNVEAAGRAGMQALLHTSGSETVAALEELFGLALR